MRENKRKGENGATKPGRGNYKEKNTTSKGIKF